jgi:hypothetical protein
MQSKGGLLEKFADLIFREAYPTGTYLSQLIKKFMEENPKAGQFFSEKSLEELTELWFFEEFGKITDD